MSISTQQFELGLEVFRGLIAADAPLAAELRDSRIRYFQGPSPSGTDDAVRLAAERRHLEWFLFENVSQACESLPVEHLLEAWAARVDVELRESADSFLQSQAGIFEVTEVEPGEATWVRDLTGLGDYSLEPTGTLGVLRREDVLVGRIFPIGGSLHHLSPGAGLFRSPELLEAIHQDLDHLRSARRHAVIRLAQIELEAMFWGGAETPSETGDPVGELESFLIEGGVSTERINGWIQFLAGAERELESLVPDASNTLAGILDELAFETDLDLEETRRLFLAAWGALIPKPGPAVSTPTPDAEADVARAIAEFDADRARGLDIESSFRFLEKRLGLETEEEEDRPAPDFPGVVGAMVEEFLWEVEREEGTEVRDRHEDLRVFGGYAEGITVFENLGARELLSFAAFWLPESRRIRSGAEAERLVRSLEAFGRWADSTQDIGLMTGELAAQLEGLRRSLPRAVVANALLPRDSETVGELFEFLGPGAGDRARIMDPAGEEREVPFEARLLAVLEEGDLLRGQTDDSGSFVVCCCYPPEASGLRQSLR